MKYARLVFYAAILGAVYLLLAPPAAAGRGAVAVSGSLSDVLGQGVSVAGAL